MHLYVEPNLCISHTSDHKILSMSWMSGDCDDKGVLALSSDGGFVGINFTSIKENDILWKKTYNLYNHQHVPQIIRVQWNDVLEELATCDECGNTYLWVFQRESSIIRDKYICGLHLSAHGDETVVVVDMAWSHDSRTLIVCQNNGKVTAISLTQPPRRTCFTLIHPRSERTFLCVAFSPDDQSVYFGTMDGQLALFEMFGNVDMKYRKLCHRKQCPVTSVMWNFPRFFHDWDYEEWRQIFILAVGLADGTIYFMKDYDDEAPNIVQTDLYGPKMQWSMSGDKLAVAGYNRESYQSGIFDAKSHGNVLLIFSYEGKRLANVSIDQNPSSIPITVASAVVWGHGDQRIFVAVGSQVHSVRILLNDVGSLQQLCCSRLCSSLHVKYNIPSLALPPSIRSQINPLLHCTMAIPLPWEDREELHHHLRNPSSCKQRFQCTLIRTSSSRYNLFLEYLGNLIPLLSAKRLGDTHAIFQPTSDPNIDRSSLKVTPRGGDTETEDNTCPVLALLTCNKTKTHFKIYSTEPKRTILTGRIRYKPSLFRLGPRQITVTLIETAPAVTDEKSCPKQAEFDDSLFPLYHDLVIHVDVRTNPPNVKSLTQPVLPFEFCCEYTNTSWTKLLAFIPVYKLSYWTIKSIKLNMNSSSATHSNIYSVNTSDNRQLQNEVWDRPIIDPLVFVSYEDYLVIFESTRPLENTIIDVATQQVSVRDSKASHNTSRLLTLRRNVSTLFKKNNVLQNTKNSKVNGKCCIRSISLRNKSPSWNQVRSLYELMFNGRATLQSEKNCQFVHRGDVAMQFGKISDNNFTLDFEYPFSAIQAFAIALSSLTHGLK